MAADMSLDLYDKVTRYVRAMKIKALQSRSPSSTSGRIFGRIYPCNKTVWRNFDLLHVSGLAGYERQAEENWV
jgi:hypothetical protein